MNKYIITLIALLNITFSFCQENSKHIEPDSVRVSVSFIVETSGEITNVEIHEIECEGCSRKYKKQISKESIRVVKEYPNRKPIEKRIKCIIPIKYTL
ncbi:hypothetical protein [Brumimicrobium aurantiacum]|uniref:TonB C-terminal domain-containing protein n=1 Tax=Brumimicrobium aurantiacum TaxID=1737063 RepID=A0A3E1EUZ0_9FLAO|nr:hypothetical protein [Brumimicrobium aurantiacum]RFC53365.1 hypothetical protein DXU93_13105 [Brumimicrobium aurantiacum]